jgi:mannose-1-phosphate guanylyltransferase
MYLARIGDFVREFYKHSPDIAILFDAPNIQEAYMMYAGLPDRQIDVAISEKSDRISVVPMHILWSDVGTWDRIYSVSNLDVEHNTFRGDVVIEDVTNSLLWNMDSNRLLVVEGMEDVVVVQTKESTYITPRSKPSKIKKLLQKIPFEKQ